MVDHLDDIFVVNMDVSNRSGNIVLILASVITRALEKSSKEEIIKLFSKSK